MFFLKKSTVNIDCFVPTSYAFALEFAPVQKATKFIPSWFKNLPDPSLERYLKHNINTDVRNAKGCVGILNSLTEGYVIPLWSELRVECRANQFNYKFTDGISVLMNHPSEQVTGFGDSHGIIKLSNPWIIKFSKPTRVVSLPLTYHLGIEYPLKTVHGINETITDHNIMSSSQFFLFDKRLPLDPLILKHNSPIFHFLPTQDYNYVLRCYVDDQKYNYYNSTMAGISFVRNGFKKSRLFDKLLKIKRKGF